MADNTIYRRKLGVNLFTLREMSGLNRNAMEALSGVSVPTIYRLETSTNSFQYETLRKIAAVFGFTADEIEKIDVKAYSPEAIHNRVEHYRKTHKIDDATAVIVKNSYNTTRGATYYIERLAKDNYFIEPRTVKEIRETLIVEYGVDFKPGKITTCLKSKSYISSNPIGKNQYEYYSNSELPATRRRRSTSKK